MTEVRRLFFNLDDKEIGTVEDAEAAAIVRSAFGQTSDWDDVLKSRLIILLAEAQSGKTYECQTRQQALWAAGEPAFYVELASVAAQPWRELRSPEEEERLQRWRSSDAETATIFLDSLDELKLTQGRFHAALRNVANDLQGQMHRIRIVLTSRPLPVDRDLFAKTFAAPASQAAPTERDFAKLAMGKDKPSDSEAPPDVRYVSLLPLTHDDIAQLARDRDIEDTDAFLDGLRNASMLDFMRRPQDVIEAASAWRELGGRFGTHAEQVAFDIKARLKSNPERHDRPLEHARAFEGAKRLALAVVLTQRLTIRHDVNNDPSDASTALDPADILDDWREDDRKALLERALFGFSTYGRVRFHNRLAFEFLAAERLSDLLEAGLSRRAIRRLLVIQTAQGVDVIRPSLRDVGAWLALRQPWVCELLNQLDPEVLMNLGDPGSLSVEQRQKLLSTYIDRFGTGGWRGLSVPQIQIHRFAHVSLEPIIRDRFETIENPEVRQTLLDVIAHSRIAGCADLARGVVWSKDAHIYERTDAFDALIALDDPDLDKIVTAVRAGPGPWEPRFVRLIVYRLFPRHMTVAALLAILDWLPETRSTGAELSRNLPPLIADLAVDQLDDLRQGLMSLTDVGLHFDKSLHVAKNDRPHLIHLLAATCARLLAEAAWKAELARSIALAAALARDVRSDEEVPAALAAAVDQAPSEARSAIFLEDVQLLRRLHPEQERLELFVELVWRGSLRVRPEDDAWLQDIVGDRKMSADARAAALLIEIMVIAKSGENGHAQLESLRGLVADDQALADTLEKRLAPHTRGPQERRYAICSKRRKRQQERRDAKDEASWIMFWRELKNDPATAFDPLHVESTAWNLWRVMKQGGARSPSCGWNRPLIEKHLGKDVADRLRSALLPVWRRESPPLSAERADDQRNILYERWILGLAAITAEAEDPDWYKNLSPSELAIALRYVVAVSSSFPAWLDTLAAAYPSEVDKIVGGEIGLELSVPTPAQGYSIALQNVFYAAPALASLFLPRLRSWLAATGGLPQPGDDLDGFPTRLDQIVAILLKFGDDADRTSIAAMASAALAGGTSPALARVWLPALFEVSPELAVDQLEKICAAAGIARENEAVRWFAHLFGGLRHGTGIDLHRPGMSPKLLLRLIRLAYKHVERGDDAVHEGSFSPDLRDNAETARNMLLSAVLNLGGAEGWAAKHEIANDPAFSHLRDRLRALALEKSAGEADNLAMAPAEVAKLDARKEPGPRTSAEMFALMTDRFDDLCDHLLGDASPRDMWALVREERLMRRAISEHLEKDARGAYAVGQEGVTADEKETDIRMRSTVNPIEGVIELKIGDKQYSAADLKKTLSDQLVSKYLAPTGRRAGILVITRAKREAWGHPDTGERLDFEALITLLRREAKILQDSFPDEIHIDVVGIDLKPRLKTERESKADARQSASTDAS